MEPARKRRRRSEDVARRTNRSVDQGTNLSLKHLADERTAHAQQKIEEKYRKGRERSLRTRTRNIEKRKQLEESVRQLETENASIMSILRDAFLGGDYPLWTASMCRDLDAATSQICTEEDLANTDVVPFLRSLCATGLSESSAESVMFSLEDSQSLPMMELYGVAGEPPQYSQAGQAQLEPLAGQCSLMNPLAVV